MSDFEPRWERVARAPQQKGPFTARQSTRDFSSEEENEEQDQQSVQPTSSDPHPLAMWLWLFALLFLLGLAGLLAWQLFR